MVFPRTSTISSKVYIIRIGVTYIFLGAGAFLFDNEGNIGFLLYNSVYFLHFVE